MVFEEYPELLMEDEAVSGVKIAVMGIGGGGTNALNYMINKGISGVLTVAVNTDVQHLNQSPAQQKIQIGREVSRGFGAGANPEKGKQAAEESEAEIKQVIADSDIVIISAGMGGGTGTGASPVIARIAKEMDKLTIAVVTLPFSFEGKPKMRKALKGIHELKGNVDSLIMISNDALLRGGKKTLSIKDMFALADEVLYKTVKAIVDIIMKPGLVNLDLEDIRTVLTNSGMAIIGEGVGEGDNRAEEAVKKAIRNPIIEGVKSIEGARTILLNIQTSEDREYAITNVELETIARVIKETAHKGGEEPEIIWGLTFDNELEEKLRVIVIAGGLSPNLILNKVQGKLSMQRTIPTVRQLGHPTSEEWEA